MDKLITTGRRSLHTSYINAVLKPAKLINLRTPSVRFFFHDISNFSNLYNAIIAYFVALLGECTAGN